MTKKKAFSVLEPSTNRFLSAGLTFGLVLDAILICYFCRKYIVEDFDSSVFPLLAILTLFPLLFIIKGTQEGLFQRMLLRLFIDEQGIHCFGLGWTPFEIPWASVRTYGHLAYSVSYVGKQVLFFSSDKRELAPKTIQAANQINSCRVVIHLHEDVWVELQKYMPDDMRRKLIDAVNKGQECFHKR